MSAFRYQHGDRPLDGYEIQQGIGRGGFGEVYFAVSDSGRQVALKFLQNYEDVELRGISHCMNLKSPHLVTIFDVKQNEQNQSFVIMEYVSGPSLRDILDQAPGGLGPGKSAFLLREIAKGLTYLHDNGVVHRDLKPHNVFFEEGIVKIGDYSLSKMMTASHRSGHTMTVGTVHYMAPEISMGKYDSRVDIYALGIIAYEFLTGQPPFTGESMGEVLMKHMTSSPDVSMLQEPFRSAIDKALAKDPNERFQSAQEFVENLFGVDYVRNSVTAFNPNELSIIGERVEKKVLANAGNRLPFQAHNMSPGIAPTAYHDSSQVPKQPQPMEFAEVVESTFEENKTSNAYVGADKLTYMNRLLIAAFTCGMICVGGALLTALQVGLPVISVFLSLLLPVMVVSFGISKIFEGDAFRKSVVYPFSSFLFLIFGFFLLVFSSLPGFATGLFDHLANFPYFMPIFILSFFHWNALTDPNRKQRISIPAVMFASFMGLLVSFSFQYLSEVTITLAGGIALGIQLLSPMHTKGSVLHTAAKPTAKPRSKANESPQEISPHGRWGLFGVALIFFPFLVGGLHRFRVGKRSSGVLWICTLGLAAIGQIVDIILILTGNFYDAAGRRVLNWESQEEKATPVNHLSSIPAKQVPEHTSKWLPRFGYGTFMLGAFGPLLLLLGATFSATGITKDWEQPLGNSFFDFAFREFSVAWPVTVQFSAAMFSIPIFGVAAALLFFARRNQHAGKIAAVFFACALALGSNWCLVGGAYSVHWDEVYASMASSSSSAFLLVMQSGFVPCVASALVLQLIASVILIVSRRHANASVELTQ